MEIPAWFYRQRQCEEDALALLIKTEDETYDLSKSSIRVEPLDLPEETDDDKFLFVGRLKRERNMLHDVFAQFYAQGHPFTTRLDFKTWYGYNNVFAIDKGFLERSARIPPSYTCWPVIVRAADAAEPTQDMYAGFVWTFYTDDNDFLGMIGIRASLAKVLRTGPRERIADKIIDAVIAFAAEKGKSKIIVPQPLWPMRPILKRRGFCEVGCAAGSTAESRFIQPVCETSIYYVLSCLPNSRPSA
jgi:hypothetical protein